MDRKVADLRGLKGDDGAVGVLLEDGVGRVQFGPGALVVGLEFCVRVELSFEVGLQSGDLLFDLHEIQARIRCRHAHPHP